MGVGLETSSSTYSKTKLSNTSAPGRGPVRFYISFILKGLIGVNCADPHSDLSLRRITSTFVLLSVLFQILRSGQVSV